MKCNWDEVTLGFHSLTTEEEYELELLLKTDFEIKIWHRQVFFKEKSSLW